MYRTEGRCQSWLGHLPLRNRELTLHGQKKEPGRGIVPVLKFKKKKQKPSNPYKQTNKPKTKKAIARAEGYTWTWKVAKDTFCLVIVFQALVAARPHYTALHLPGRCGDLRAEVVHFRHYITVLGGKSCLQEEKERFRLGGQKQASAERSETGRGGERNRWSKPGE